MSGGRRSATQRREEQGTGIGVRRRPGGDDRDRHLIGFALGGIFGAAVTRIAAFRLSSIRKGVGLGILYTEIVSLPILVMPPIIPD